MEFRETVDRRPQTCNALKILSKAGSCVIILPEFIDPDTAQITAFIAVNYGDITTQQKFVEKIKIIDLTGEKDDHPPTG